MNVTREYFGPVNIEKINVQLLDEFTNEIDLNYMDVSLYFEFELKY